MKRSGNIEDQLRYTGESPNEKRGYEKLIDALEKEPSFQLSTNFSNKVLGLIEKKESTRNRVFWLLSIIGISVILVSFVVGMIYVYGWDGIKQFQNLTYWAVTAGVMITIFQFLEGKLIRKPGLSGVG